MRSWVASGDAFDANHVADELDGIAPLGSGLILFSLFERHGRTVGELPQQSKVTHVVWLHLIKRMEAARLLKREQGPLDGRATRVWPTKLGRDLEPGMQALHERNIATPNRVLGGLPGRLIEWAAAHPESLPIAEFFPSQQPIDSHQVS